MEFASNALNWSSGRTDANEKLFMRNSVLAACGSLSDQLAIMCPNEFAAIESEVLNWLCLCLGKYQAVLVVNVFFGYRNSFFGGEKKINDVIKHTNPLRLSALMSSAYKWKIESVFGDISHVYDNPGERSREWYTFLGSYCTLQLAAAATDVVAADKYSLSAR